MRWPWVSRELYDTCQGVANRLLQERDRERAERLDVMRQAETLQREVGQERETAVQWWQKYTDLVERVLQMKREGFEPPPAPAPEPEPPLPDPVEQAIVDRAVDPVTERTLRQYARQRLTTDTPAQVRQRILDGEDVEAML